MINSSEMKIRAKQEASLFEILSSQFPDSPPTRIRKWIRLGAVRNGQEILNKPDHHIEAGTELDFSKPKLNFTPLAKHLPFEVLYEDEHLLAVIKPPGLLTIRAGEEKEASLFGLLNEKLQELSRTKTVLHVVHRLDKEVSGIVLFAKSQEIREKLIESWSTNEKVYAALVEGRPVANEGRIHNWLKEGPSMKVIPAKEGEGKEAISEYRLVRTLGPYSLLEVKLVTGRKNQIRAHLSGMNCPIVGDRRYGSRERYRRRIRLFAKKLAFTHPIEGRRIQIEAPLPRHFLHLFPQHES